MKTIFNRKSFVVKTNKHGSALVNLTDNSRKDYKGDLPHGTLLTKRTSLNRLKPAGIETNIHDLTTLHKAYFRGISKSEEAEALSLIGAANPQQASRRDLRSLPTFTIDGADSKDLDDAISAVKEGAGYRVWVHIADVSSYIIEGSKLDRGARKRLTSIYLPDSNLPMLPRSISESNFSLLPGVDRLAFTMEFFIVEGEVVQSSLYSSTINSDAKLTYDQVSDFLRSSGELPESVRASVEAARDAIDLDVTFSEATQEYKFLVDEGTVTDYSAREAGPSNKLIETYMVMTNTEAGKLLKHSDVAGIYRVHSLVDEEKRALALAKVNSLFPLPQDCTFEEASELVAASDDPRKLVLLKFLLHTTPPAEYSTTAGSHGGLKVDAYAQFTSPIRRYSDLLNHRQLKATLGLGDAMGERKLAKIAEALNEVNFKAKKTSRLMSDLFLNSHLEHSLANGEYRGKQMATVEGFAASGAFCSFGHGKDGMLFLDQLGPGELNEERTIFTGKYRNVVVGDQLPITIGRPDLARGRLAVRFYRERSSKRRK